MEPRVVDEHVDGAPLGKHPAEHGLDLGLVADVRFDGQCLHSVFSDFGGDGFRIIGCGGVVHDDIGAGAAQCDRDRLADSRTGAGNEGFLAPEEREDRSG